jgi:hypothetical protein
MLFLACHTEPNIATCAGDQFTDIEAGVNIECQIDNTGCLQCQGLSYAEIDTNQIIREGSVPAEPPDGSFIDVEVTHFHENSEDYPPFLPGCALDQAGAFQCWDGNEPGETEPVIFSPVPGEGFIGLAIGFTDCGLHADGTLECPGAYWAEGLEVPPGTYTKVTSGWGIAALSTSSTIVWWDYESYESAPGFLDVEVGYGEYCALHDEDGLLCWSPGVEPLLETASYSNPEITGSKVCVTWGLVSVLQTDGSVWCRDCAVQPEFDVPLTSLSCGYSICGLTETGEARCWREDRGMWAIKPGKPVE